ncbi:MAG: hypothetical protein ACPGJS_13695 [Flammeovirgaceae bacterium]
MNIRNLISFTIIGGATFLVLYLFTNYNLPFTIATSVVVGTIYVFFVSQVGRKLFYNRVLKKLLEKQKEKE